MLPLRLVIKSQVNFVGKQKELVRAVDAINNDKISDSIRMKIIFLQKIPSISSHMDDVWKTNMIFAGLETMINYRKR